MPVLKYTYGNAVVYLHDDLTPEQKSLLARDLLDCANQILARKSPEERDRWANRWKVEREERERQKTSS